ncbi:MAG: TetR family transcriptional regulator C-terminal domain-containing protein [Clostridiales bacterium]|jgi:AcrR family transcriptional regulator|nr:TetR family transcriptional regulator C-terminal domain-containing protein [Clostridiales bacterium]
MGSKKLDRRVQYTKAILRQSLLELMLECPVSKITVTELCVRANVNRNTFYAHYDCPETLLAQIEDELFDKMRDTLSRMQSDNLEEFILEICRTIVQNKDLCKYLFSATGDNELRKLLSIAKDRSLNLWEMHFASRGDKDRVNWETVFTYITGGSIAVIREWIQNDLRESPQEVADFLGKCSYNGLRAFGISQGH